METIALFETSAVACARALVFFLNNPFWGAQNDDFWSWAAIHIKCLVTALQNITHRQTTAYHPESNGAVERLHRLLKDALCACTAVATWAEEIPWVLLVLCAQPREDTDLSPAEPVFGAPFVSPNEFLQADKISVETISKILKKNLWILLLFLCLGATATPAAVHPGSPVATKQASPAGIFTISAGAAENPPWNRFSCTPRGALHALGQQLLSSLHKVSTCSASGNRLSTSDLIRSSPEASAWGGALWRLPTPLVCGQPQHGDSSSFSSIIVPVNKPLVLLLTARWLVRALVKLLGGAL